MSQLVQLSLPGGVKLVWASNEWVPLIVPNDSIKKRIVTQLIKAGFSRPFQQIFDGKIKLGVIEIALVEILEAVAPPGIRFTPMAIFVNARRNTPRTYVWLKGDDAKWYFLKIGLLADEISFNNELAIFEHVRLEGNLTVSKPINLVTNSRWTALLTEGLSPADLRNRKTYTSNMLVSSPLFLDFAKTGPFGGCIHCDLNAGNIFEIGDLTWVADWEYAAIEGPDFCDIVGLAARSFVATTDSHIEIKKLLEARLGYDISHYLIKEALEFLAWRGMSSAKRFR